jgi:CBS domain-containing protein/predicted RNA-binding Zn-ribbon protein involved in translation (DUF1610 family)
MTHVREIMTPSAQVPKVNRGATVLEATALMKKKGTSAVAVVDTNGKVVGFFGERILLTEFAPLNKRPDEVRVGELMQVLYKVGPEASTKDAADVIVKIRANRLGVYDEDRFVGWVTLTDLARHFSRESLLDRLRMHNKPEIAEYRCPKCRKAFMGRVTDRGGQVLRWDCPNCGHSL